MIMSSLTVSFSHLVCDLVWTPTVPYVDPWCGCYRKQQVQLGESRVDIHHWGFVQSAKGVSLNYSLTCTSRHTSSQSVDESSVVPDHIRAAVSFGGFSQARCGNLSVQLSSVVLCRPLWRSWWGKNTFRFSLYMKHLCLESENSDSHPSVLPAERIELQNVDRTVIKDQFVPSSIKILNSSS